MNKLILFAILVFSPMLAVAQSADENSSADSFKITLYTIRTGASGDFDVPDELQPAIKELKTDFHDQRFSLVARHRFRVSTGGSIRYRSLFEELDQTGNGHVPATWAMRVLETRGNSAGFRELSFEARIPISGKIVSGAEGRYESVSLSNELAFVPIGTPAVVGSVPLPGSDDMIFIALGITRD